MIDRKMKDQLIKLANWFPVVAITGPRQSGKTTLSKLTFPDYEYINLEDRDFLAEAIDDPMGFIKNRPEKLIIDEAQLAPDLFSAIQVVSDERGSTGQYILSGSQNFLLAKNVKQSLAGRCAYVDLLPLSYKEATSFEPELDIFDFALKGGYPRIYDVNIPETVYYETYLKTYVERDVHDFLQVRNLSDYKKLVYVLASQASNLLNLTQIANSCDIAVNTVKSWLSLLESSYITYMLYPYHANLKKRLTKSPKIYFYDTGLLCYLLGIKDVQELKLSPYKGAIIENLIISETIKKRNNVGEHPDLYFYRDDSKIEIDLLDFTDRSNKMAFEIKTTGLFNKKQAKNLISTADKLGVKDENQILLLNTEYDFQAQGVNVGSIEKYLLS